MLNKLAVAKQKFLHFFLAPAPVLPLVFLRVSFAFLVLALSFFIYPNLQDLYGSDGYMQWVISDHIFKKDFIPNLHDLYDLLNRFGNISAAAVVQGTFVFYMVCIVSIGVGFFSNAFALVAWHVHLLFLNTGSIYGYGVETFIHTILFYLVFMPVDAAWSVTSLVRRNRFKQPGFKLQQQVFARISLRLLQIHLCIIYANAGIAKMTGTQWYNGEAVWRSFTQFPFNSFSLSWTAFYPYVLIIAGWFVLALETLYPIFIWVDKIRKWWLPGIVLMHISIAVFMRLYFFSGVMIVINLAAFGFDASPKRFKEKFRRSNQPTIIP